MRWLALALFVAACHPAGDHKLPGASRTPRMLARTSSPACGIDIALDGNVSPEIRYRYTYDSLGRLVRASGTYSSGAADTVDYTWDNLDNLTRRVQTRAWDGTHSETASSYDTLGDLVLYTNTQTAPHYSDAVTYTFSEFDESGQPAIEHMTLASDGEHAYRFEYDAANRMSRAIEDTGSTTTYTYDDAESRTITIDTDHGAYHGVLSYDDDNHQLAEAWTGTQTIDTETRYDWSADRLLTITYRSGSQDAPRDLRVYEVDTLRYDCASR